MFVYIHKAYNGILLSQFSSIHTSTTIHNMNIVMTTDFWVAKCKEHFIAQFLNTALH
jgi:hypothetical protein